MQRLELGALLDGRGRRVAVGPTVVEEREPLVFMRRFADAVVAGGPVFLADPAWAAAERDQLQALAQQPGDGAAEDGWLGIPTGGSSGTIKLARHDGVTLAAAVRGFAAHFQVPTVHAVGVLPLHHVSGLMAWLRCAMTGGRYEPWSWKDLEAGDRPPLGRRDWFLSLVPTQLERLLADPAAVEWLRRFRAILVGGGPCWPELVERAAELRLSLSLTYGMTETAAMVTALRPEEFLAGGRGQGTALPHGQVEVGDDGALTIRSDALFRGYWPERRPPGPWGTEDMGGFDERESLHVYGRRDALIISGGEKIDPAEVEAALRATGRFVDVAVVGVADATWGEIVVACHPAGGATVEPAELEGTLAGRLARFKWPKRYVPVEPWPRNAQGKVSRAALLASLRRP
jgi:o-succinylbenzoate---CoA ligase